MSLHAGLPLWDPHWVIWTSFLLSVCREVLGTNDRIGDWRSPIGLLPTPLKLKERDFLRGPVAKTSPFSAGGMGSMLGGGAKITHALQFSSVQFSRSVVSNSLRPHKSARQASQSITNSQSLLKPMSIESVMPSSHLILCRPLLLPPPIPPSIRVFSNESTLLIRWPKYWSFSISPSNDHPGLITLFHTKVLCLFHAVSECSRIEKYRSV